MNYSDVIAHFKKQTILVLLLASIAVSITSLIILNSAEAKKTFNREMVIHTYEVLQNTEKLLSGIKDAEIGQRGYLLLGDGSYLEPYENARKQTKATIGALKNLTIDNPEQQERLNILSSLTGQKFDELQQTINLRAGDTTGLAGALQIVKSAKSKTLMRDIRSAIDALKNTEKSLLENRNNDLASTQKFAVAALWISTAFIIIILVMGIRNIILQIRSREKLYADLEIKNRNLLFNKGGDIGAVDEQTAVTNLIENLTNATAFIRNVSLQKYTEPYIGLSPGNENLNKDNLAGALVDMRSQMIKVSEEERRRNWAIEGLAKFAVILRSGKGQVHELYSGMISQVVKYINANQAALFILNEEDHQHPYLELVSCYAYSRKKYIEKKIEINEGLVGQAFKEKEIIHMTSIPDDYISITSGLGEAIPASLLIVPLKMNDTVTGVLELASFNPFQPHEIGFLEKLAENMAATISNIQVSERTRRLLEASQQQAEELKATEEEMRQNMEELHATQEETERKNGEIRRVMAESNSVLHGINATMATVEFTPDGTIIEANTNFLTVMKYTLAQIKGKQHRIFVPLEILDPEEYQTFWTKLATGQAISGIFRRSNAHGETVWLNAIYTPISSTNGEIVKVVKFAIDITGEKEKEAEIQHLLEDASVREEELRQNMHELEAQKQIMNSTLETLNEKLEEINTLKKDEEIKTKQMLDEIEQNRGMLTKIIEELPEKIFLKDEDGRLILFNSLYAASYDAETAKKLMGTNDFDNYPYEMAAQWRQTELDIIESGKESVLYEEFPDGNGETRINYTVKKPFRLKNGKMGLIGYQMDVTEMKRDEKSTKESEEQIKKIEMELQEKIDKKQTIIENQLKRIKDLEAKQKISQ